MPYKFLSDMPCSLCRHTVRCCAANQASLMDVAKQELHTCWRNAEIAMVCHSYVIGVKEVLKLQTILKSLQF